MVDDQQTTPGATEAMHRWIEEEHVVERYLQHRLSAEAIERFEEHYLGCEQCVEELEVAERLRGALRGVALEDAVQVQVGLMAWLGRRLQQRSWLLALPLLLLTVVGGFGWNLASERDRLASELATLQAPRPVTATALLDVVRSDTGGSEPPAVTLSVGDGPGQTLLALAVTSAVGAEFGAEAFDVELTETQQGTLWQAGGLQATADGLLYLTLPSEMLRPGDYGLQVAPTASRDATSHLTFRFRVVSGSS